MDVDGLVANKQTNKQANKQTSKQTSQQIEPAKKERHLDNFGPWHALAFSCHFESASRNWWILALQGFSSKPLDGHLNEQADATQGCYKRYSDMIMCKKPASSAYQV